MIQEHFKIIMYDFVHFEDEKRYINSPMKMEDI